MRPRLIALIFFVLLAAAAAQALFFESREMQSGRFLGSPSYPFAIWENFSLNDSGHDGSGLRVTNPSIANDSRDDTQILVVIELGSRPSHTYLLYCKEVRYRLTLLDGTPQDWNQYMSGLQITGHEPRWKRFVAHRYPERRVEIEQRVEELVLENIFNNWIAPSLTGYVEGPAKASFGENIWKIGCSNPWPVFAAGAWARFWKIAVALGVLLGVSLAIWKLAALVNEPVDPTRCPKCGYGLNESGLCSECGYGAEE